MNSCMETWPELSLSMKRKSVSSVLLCRYNDSTTCRSCHPLIFHDQTDTLHALANSETLRSGSSKPRQKNDLGHQPGGRSCRRRSRPGCCCRGRASARARGPSGSRPASSTAGRGPSPAGHTLPTRGPSAAPFPGDPFGRIPGAVRR